MSTPRLFLTNDDGIAAPGLAALAQALNRTGRFELRVVAPERQCSGVGHSVTIHEPLFAERCVLDGSVPAWKVDGTPADCVKLGLTSLFPDSAVDLVIAGINSGPNVGVNVLYSGTVGAALEACINGVPALAVSLAIAADGEWRFALAAEAAVQAAEAVLKHGLPPWTVLNVNVPNVPRKEQRGFRLTRHGHSGFKEYYLEEPSQGARRGFRLEGAMVYREDDPETDAVALREGWTSVTALGLNLLDSEAARQVAAWKLFS
jgi:5'-nucleotidase